MKKGLMMVAVICLLVSVASAADYASVRKMYSDKNYAGVIKEAPAVILTVAGKEQAELTSYYGNSLVFAGQIDAGIAELKKIADIKDISQVSKDYALINISQALTKQKKYADAITAVQPLLTSKNDGPRAQAKCIVANMLRIQDKTAEALVAYETAIADSAQKDEQKVSCYIWVARINGGLEKKDAALQAYKQVILLTEKSAPLAEGMRAKSLVGAKELADTLKARQGKEVFDALIKLCYEKVFDENSKLSTYDTVYCLAAMEKLLDETTYPAELSAIWTRINRLTGIVGVNRAEVESWLKKNK
jgi:tetratricopeptide (TPR) repeat protein